MMIPEPFFCARPGMAEKALSTRRVSLDADNLKALSLRRGVVLVARGCRAVRATIDPYHDDLPAEALP